MQAVLLLWSTRACVSQVVLVNIMKSHCFMLLLLWMSWIEAIVLSMI